MFLEQKVSITDEITGVSELLGARARAAPPKDYAFAQVDMKTSNWAWGIDLSVCADETRINRRKGFHLLPSLFPESSAQSVFALPLQWANGIASFVAASSQPGVVVIHFYSFRLCSGFL